MRSDTLQLRLLVLHRFLGICLESLHISLDVHLLCVQLLDLRLSLRELLLERCDACVGRCLSRGDHFGLHGLHV